MTLRVTLIASVLALVFVGYAPAITGTTARRVIPAAAATPVSQASPASVALPEDLETAYVCPMHPDYTIDKPGRCPRCGMDLVLAAPFDMRDYQLDFQTEPPLVRPGAKTTLLFRVFHPGTGEQVKNYERVHDKLYHVFVISQDMEHFEHIHPEQRADGTWAVETTLPKAGYYQVLSDFLPSGGSSQFLSRPIVTLGYTGDLVTASAHLEADRERTKTGGGLTVDVQYDPTTFAAGQYGHLMFHLTDARTGEPVRELQPYLGAFGHTLIMSEDMVDYVHSHPSDLMPQVDNPEDLRGGPNVMFEGLMPRPGRYRAWTQFRWRDTIHTVTFTFNVFDVGELSQRSSAW